MKKFLLIAVALMVTVCVNAQVKGGTNKSKLYLEGEISTGTRYKGLQQAVNGAIDLGLMSKKIYPYIRYESSLMLYKHDGQKTYGNTYNLGGGFGIVLSDVTFPVNNAQRRATSEFTMNLTSSIGGHDYKNTSLYAGFRIRTQSGFVGLGYRHMRSRHTPIHDYRGFIVNIGLTL